MVRTTDVVGLAGWAGFPMEGRSLAEQVWACESQFGRTQASTVHGWPVLQRGVGRGLTGL